MILDAVVEEDTAGACDRLALGQLEGGVLELEEAVPERLTRLGVRDGLLDGTLDGADGLRADDEAFTT